MQLHALQWHMIAILESISAGTSKILSSSHNESSGRHEGGIGAQVDGDIVIAQVDGHEEGVEALGRAQVHEHVVIVHQVDHLTPHHGRLRAQGRQVVVHLHVREAAAVRILSL